MEKLIFLGLAIPILAFVLYLGATAIMKGFSAKEANRVEKEQENNNFSTSNDTNYISLNFPNGLLYCCLSEAYGFLKGPIDMLTLYENKYKQEVQKFASEQVGRRRRDDYTDGTLRIPIPSPNP